MIFFRFASIVFFFKQKTAYEMRISDWSSDVCSSDLRDQTDQDRPQNSKPDPFGEGPQARPELHSRPPITRIPRRPRSRPARRRRRLRFRRPDKLNAWVRHSTTSTIRSEENTCDPLHIMRHSYTVFALKKTQPSCK